MTRADAIRSASDEELAQFIGKVQLDVLEATEKKYIEILLRTGIITPKYAEIEPQLPGIEEIAKEWLEWLKKEM